MITTMTGANPSMLASANDAEAIGRFQATLLRFQDVARTSAVAAGAAIAQIGGAVAAVGGLALDSAGKLTQWVNAAIDAQAKIDEMSQKLGLSAEATSRLAATAKISGTDFDTLGKAMSKLTENAMNAAGGSRENTAAFTAMGVSITDATGRVKAGDQLLAEIADKFSGYRDGAEKSALATKLFGDAGTSLIPLLNGGSAALDDYASTAASFGAIVGGETAQAASQFQENLAALELAGAGVANQVAAEILPTLVQFSGDILEATKSSGLLTVAADVLSGALKIVGGVALAVTNVVQNMTNFVAAGFDTIGGAFDIVSGASAGVAQGIGAAYAKVTGDTKGYETMSKAASETISSSWQEGTRRISGAWSSAVDGVNQNTQEFIQYVSAVEAPIVRIDEALRKRLAPSLEAVKVAFGQFAKADGFGDMLKAADATIGAIANAFAKLNEDPRETAPRVGSGGGKPDDKTKELEAAKAKLNETLNGLHGSISPVDAAWVKFNKTVDDFNLSIDDATKKGLAEADANRMSADALKYAQTIRDREIAKIKEQGDVLGRYLREVDKSRALDGLTDRQKAVVQAVQAATKEYEANTKANIENQQSLGELQSTVGAVAAARYDEAKAAEAATAAAKRQSDIVRNGMNGMADAISNWAVNGFSKARDFWKSMVDIVKRSVAQMLAEWIKTRFIGAFFNDPGARRGATAGAFGMPVSLSGGSVVDLVTGGGASSSSGAMQTGGFQYSSDGSLFSGDSWISAGKSLWSGFSQLWYGSGQMTQLGSYLGTAAYGPGMATTWTPSALGTTLGVAGGLYAGYNRYQNSNGGLAGGLGAAAYGVGTIGVMGAVGGVLGGAGAAAGMAGAMGSIGLAAIPVIGWIAAIAMLVDMVAGGKLFGTKARTQYTDSRIDVGAEGAEASMLVTTVRQRSLFRGRQWSTSAGEVTPEMTEAANKFWKQLADIAKDVAKSIGGDVAPVIDASLRTVTEYDKKGREKATKFIVEALGRSWEEASAELATRRIAAEQMIASLDFGQKEAEASKIAERYRKEAEALADAAATMVQARADLNDGKGLLGGGDTLTSVMAWVEEQRQGDEALAATYARLSQATAQYNALVEQTAQALEQIQVGAGPVEQLRAALEQITKQTEATVKALNDAAIAAGLTAAREEDLAAVRDLENARIAQLVDGFWGNIDEQFKAITQVNTPAGDFAASMRAITQSLYDNIAQANMLARAQGQAGASTQQLARIHELAARQAASAIARLTDIGRNQVRSLYGGAFTLDQVNADIAELQSRAGTASGAVQDFGSAMGDAASAATDAMNLLLGDLSPLNDQEKLQQAMAGLAAGTVTQEQVLEIGRRLYASSANYDALFGQVTAMGGGRSGGGGGGGGGAAPQQQALTQEEQERLADLMQQRDELVRQQRINEARDLANTVAMLAAAQGESFAEVAESIGLDLEKLAKDLGMENLAELTEYLGNIDVSADPVVDAFTDNIDRLIATMKELWGPKDDGAAGGADDKSGATSTDVQVEVRRGTEANERIARENGARLDRIDVSIRELGRDFREAFAPQRSTRMTN